MWLAGIFENNDSEVMHTTCKKGPKLESNKKPCQGPFTVVPSHSKKEAGIITRPHVPIVLRTLLNNADLVVDQRVADAEHAN